MIRIAGPSALSSSGKQKVLNDIRPFAGKEATIEAQYIFFIETKYEISEQEVQLLRQLLSDGNTYDESFTTDSFIVVPRVGTISPWSSKASDIAKNAGLDFVERLERGILYTFGNVSSTLYHSIADKLHDRMVESVLFNIKDTQAIFEHLPARLLQRVDIQTGGKKSLVDANKEFGFALTDDEIEYVYESYVDLKRSPTDVELMMFAQVNSEHCRHKIFNADWIINGTKQPKSLFKMIKNTYEKSSKGTLSAYSDNAAVLEGTITPQFFPNHETNEYGYTDLADNIVIKVETHNHPTAIAPFPGAATGAGGEIRDEGATGRGSRSKMGLAGYSLSNLNIPNFTQPWELPLGKPKTVASPLAIITDAPLGAAAFANEFGRPNVLGYFRTFQQEYQNTMWGYHKPIMVAGGSGTIDSANVHKKPLYPGARLALIGGPAMLIGLGGGAASSMQTGQSSEQLDFASVQRANPEMQRRAQEVISTFARMGEKSPIISIHDVGAGGLSNAFPELVNDSNLGAEFELRDIPCDDTSMSPMEIWCNESQERYVLALNNKDVALLESICKRERCPFAIVGTATKKRQLIITDRTNGNKPVDIPMEVLFGKPPKMTREFEYTVSDTVNLDTSAIAISDAVERVLKFPAVGSKKFLITIGDRNVGGLTARDQMIGRWQVPVSDAAVTASSFKDDHGQAMSIGERPPLALINAGAAARMSVGEAITNISSTAIKDISDIKLSANWMAASGYNQEDERLYDAVKALGEEFCPELGLTIPVGKDSLSMRTKWREGKEELSVTSPLSLVITAFSPVSDVKATLTPELINDSSTELLLIDLSDGSLPLGGSVLAQVYNQIGNQSPDITSKRLLNFFKAMTILKNKNLILAYHDRSDGGLFTTLVEMAFTARVGLDIDLTSLPGTELEKLFNESLGAVIQIRSSHKPQILKILNDTLTSATYEIGVLAESENITFTQDNVVVYENTRSQLETWWAQTSYEIQKLRDNPATSKQENVLISAKNYQGLYALDEPALLNKITDKKPKVAIFREEGVNGQIEMAAAFDAAGFTAIDVHLNDIMANPELLESFSGLIACGGFSYGDVLGAGNGWAKSILFSNVLRRSFRQFFERSDTFTLGVCNGCQMLSGLKELIPGANAWPQFLQNTSGRFEARLVMAKIAKSPSIFFEGMEGACLPVPVAHGEGKVQFANTSDAQIAHKNLAALHYIDDNGTETEEYPRNPNGSSNGLTALTSSDGRATIMMPHPERAFLTKQMSWNPDDWKEYTPWFRFFQNAYNWTIKHKELE